MALGTLLDQHKIEIADARQRGIGEEAAVALLVNGFVRDVLQKLPMEFAVEAEALLGITLEGAVG